MDSAVEMKYDELPVALTLVQIGMVIHCGGSRDGIRGRAVVCDELVVGEDMSPGRMKEVVQY